MRTFRHTDLVKSFTRPPLPLSFTNRATWPYHGDERHTPARSRVPIPVPFTLTTIEFSRDALDRTSAAEGPRGGA